MKRTLNIILCAVLLSALMSCSTGRYASAQYDANENTYSNSGEDTYSDSPGDYNSYDNDYENDDYNSNGSSGVSIDVFVDQLSPYGRWITYPSYGRVWICNETGFVPYYSNGHWVYTNFGWTWASNYNWGWAPFHYGRWAYDPFYGWMWVPGYEWGPAWVGWRTGGDFYGWAPLAPGINISLGFSWGNYMPADRWCFVPRRYISDPYFHHYAVDRGRNLTIINNTTIIKNTNVYHNTRYVSGPSRTEVEKFTGNRINTIRVNNDRKPGSARIVDNKTIKMYRPQIKKDERLTSDRVNADRSGSVQSQPLQQNRNMDSRPKSEDIRTPQRNNIPEGRDHKPNIKSRIDDNNPEVKNENPNVPDTRRREFVENKREQMNMHPRQSNKKGNLNVDRNERINQERINQSRERVNPQKTERQTYRMADDNVYQNRSNINRQPVQQMPEHRIKTQSDNQQQSYHGNGRRRN